MESTTIAVDLAKSVFQIAVSRHPGKVAETHRLSRVQFLAFFAERQPSLVVLEACGTAHYWARQIQAFGHRVELLPPHRVRCYVARNKTDRADAEALLEAHRNKRSAACRSSRWQQQTLAALHRLRSAWIRGPYSADQPDARIVARAGVPDPRGGPACRGAGRGTGQGRFVAGTSPSGAARGLPGGPRLRETGPRGRTTAARPGRADAGRRTSAIDPRRRPADRHGAGRPGGRCEAISPTSRHFAKATWG